MKGNARAQWWAGQTTWTVPQLYPLCEWWKVSWTIILHCLIITRLSSFVQETVCQLAACCYIMWSIYINKRTNVNLVRECSQRWLDFQLWFLRTLIEYILPLNHWTLFFAKLFNYYGNNQKNRSVATRGCYVSCLLFLPHETHAHG